MLKNSTVVHQLVAQSAQPMVPTQFFSVRAVCYWLCSVSRGDNTHGAGRPACMLGARSHAHSTGRTDVQVQVQVQKVRWMESMRWFMHARTGRFDRRNGACMHMGYPSMPTRQPRRILRSQQPAGRKTILRPPASSSAMLRSAARREVTQRRGTRGPTPSWQLRPESALTWQKFGVV